MIESLKRTYYRLISEQKISSLRYLYSQFTIEERLVGLVGPRGVGKTTLLLQFIKNHFHDLNQAFYVSADHIYFNSNTLYQFVENLYVDEAVHFFFIDEIHKYRGWDQELKNLYDGFPKIKIVFSGSSSLDLVKGSYDLSRRTKMFTLQGLSFREYLNLKTHLNFPVIDYDKLLSTPTSYNELLTSIPQLKNHFKNYLMEGYYPFFLESSSTVFEKILRVIDKTIYEDIATFYNLKTQNLLLFKKILNYFSSVESGRFNQHNIAKNLSIDDKTASHYITILQETGLLRFILPYAKGNPLLRKPEKVILTNTTLTYALNSALGENASLGLIRELFFLQSLQNAGISVFHSDVGDYRTKDFLFEIGGKNKTALQIKDSKLPTFLVKDDTLFASKREIPLMLFGFLY